MAGRRLAHGDPYGEGDLLNDVRRIPGPVGSGDAGRRGGKVTVLRNTVLLAALDCGGGRRAGMFGSAACASAALAQSAERFTRNE